jgi:hypothetical protein
MQVDGVAFESPAGLEDSTSYCFAAESTPEELTVEFELPVGEGEPAAAVIAESREGLEQFFEAKFAVVAEGSTTLAGEPGQFLTYRVAGDEKVLSKIVVANVGPPAGGAEPGADDPARRDWVKIAWGDDRELDAIATYVDPILASFSPADQPPATVLPGHVRQQAGPWVLDLPAHLHGPRTFIFEDPEAELRVELSVLEADAEEPTLEPGVAGYGGEETSRDERELDGGERIDLRLRSDDDPHGESTLILAKRELELAGERAGESRWVVLSATAPSSQHARLEQIADELLASIHAVGEGRG